MQRAWKLLASLIITTMLSMCCPYYVVRVASSPTYYDQRFAIIDQSPSGRPIAGVNLVISGIKETLKTGADGSVELNLVPAGILEIVATWKSIYNPEPVTIATSSVVLDRTLDITIVSKVYDVELKLVSSSGKPIVNAEVRLAGVPLGMTGTDGKVIAMQVPGYYKYEHRPYPVATTWLGEDVSPGDVDITATGTYVLTAKNVSTLTVHVTGAQGQGLKAAQVEIKTASGITVFSGLSNEQGFVSVEVPYGTYGIRADYKGFTNAATTTVNSPEGTVHTVQTSVFVEALGMAMSFATFVLWMIVAIIVTLALAIAIHEYHIYRRKRLPQLFGAPRGVVKS